MKKTVYQYTPFLFLLLIVATILFFANSCKKDPKDTANPVIEEPEQPEDPNYGWGRLAGIPLLGYGVPEDQRAKAREYIDVARTKRRERGCLYPDDYASNSMYDAWRGISLRYIDENRLYENAKKEGYAKLYPNAQRLYSRFVNNEAVSNAYKYLTDTVIIYIGGGPNYDKGIDHSLWVYERLYIGDPKLSATSTYEEDFAFIPATSNLLAREYNLPNTSIIEVPHPTAGVMDYHGLFDEGLTFFDYATACGNYEKAWPENTVSYQDAGIICDMGVELLRLTVEELKRQGKTIVFWGTSWGAYTMSRYLLYYPIEDFAHVELWGFCPNRCKGGVESIREFANGRRDVGTILLGQELYEMTRWRMLPWLTRLNLDRLRIVIGDEDDHVGPLSQTDIKKLTNAGATVMELIGQGHGFMYSGYATVNDSVVHQPWENHMRIHTKNGTKEIISNVWNHPMDVKSQKINKRKTPSNNKITLPEEFKL